MKSKSLYAIPVVLLAAFLVLAIWDVFRDGRGTPVTYGAAGPQSPIVPVSWTATATWIDPVNGSDTNNMCTAQASPCKTWHHLHDQVWQCFGSPGLCPRFTANHVTTFLNSQPDGTDPIYINAAFENQSSLIIEGTLGAAQKVATGTLLAVTAKNRATPQPLASTFTITAPDGGAAPALAAGEFVINSTHASAAWINTVANPNVLTQPIARYTINGGTSQAEVDTWANGDTIDIYVPINVNVSEVSGHVSDWNTTSFSNGVVFWNVNAMDPNAGAFNLDALLIAGDVGPVFAESQVSRSVDLIIPSTTIGGMTFLNSDIVGVLTSGATPFRAQTFVTAGQIRTSGATLNSATIDKDTIVNVSMSMGGGSLGFVYIPSGKTLTVNGAPTTVTSTGVLYGAGTLNVAGFGRVAYPAGASKAAAAFKMTGFQINGQTKYLTVLPTSATGIVTGNTTLTAAALDTSFGTVTGCAMGAGALICNAP